MTAADCRWHGGLCAKVYRDDPARCPFCHRSWERILAGRHSCESGVWHSGDRWKAVAARDMRQDAEEAWRNGRSARISSQTLTELAERSRRPSTETELIA